MPKTSDADGIAMDVMKPIAATPVSVLVPVVRTAPATPDQPPARRGRKVMLWAAIAVAGIVLAVLFILAPWAVKPLPVAVETVSLAPLTRVLAVNGRLVAQHEVAVRSRVGGAVLALGADEGEAVTAGQMLIRIDPAGQQAVVRQALAALDAGLVAQAETQATLDRDRALGATVTRVRVEEAERAAQSAVQEVARLTALFDQAQISLGHYTIVAPIAGIVLDRGPQIGQIVDISTDLFTLADLAMLVVETNVDEAYATQIKEGQQAVLQLIGEAEARAGRVSFVAPQVDQATGGLTVELKFDAPVQAPVGLTVTANITVDAQDAAISVPRAAVVSTAAGSAVFLVEAGVARRRDVRVVPWPAERLMVTEGLSAGDMVIVDATGVIDGQSVTVMPLDPTGPVAKGASD